MGLLEWKAGRPHVLKPILGGVVWNYSSMRILRLATDRLKNGR